jgi:pSer/pThr/pTyr-binding forkhead associated (FHA) protein
MPARLVPLTAGSAPTIVLQRPVVLIGRHPECDVRIDLPQVSRRHCCIALAYDRLLIRDLGSRNGVRVNGRLIEECSLRQGDEVAIGQIIFRLEDYAAPPAKAFGAPAAAAPVPDTSSPPEEAELPVMPLDTDSELIPLDDLPADA